MLAQSMTVSGKRILALLFFAPVLLHAQALTIPVASIGECTASPNTPTFLTKTAGLRGAHVVIAADQPERRREIALFVDQRGQPVDYAEMSYGPMLSGAAAEDIVWAKDSSGTVRTFRLRHTREPAGVIHHERLELSATDQKGVQSMIAWMRTRCRGVLGG